MTNALNLRIDAILSLCSRADAFDETKVNRAPKGSKGGGRFVKKGGGGGSASTPAAPAAAAPPPPAKPTTRARKPAAAKAPTTKPAATPSAAKPTKAAASAPTAGAPKIASKRRAPGGTSKAAPAPTKTGAKSPATKKPKSAAAAPKKGAATDQPSAALQAQRMVKDHGIERALKIAGEELGNSRELRSVERWAAVIDTILEEKRRAKQPAKEPKKVEPAAVSVPKNASPQYTGSLPDREEQIRQVKVMYGKVDPVVHELTGNQGKYRAHSVLDGIIKATGKNEFANQLATKLRSFIDDVEIERSAMPGDSGVFRMGGDGQPDTIWMGAAAGTHTILHEMVHAATVRFLENTRGEDSQLRDELYELREYAERKYMEELKKFEGDEREKRRLYGMRDPSGIPAEFLAEAMTNPSFQKWLAGIKHPSGKSVFHRFVAVVGKILGFGKGNDLSNSLLAHVMSANERVMEEQMARFRNPGNKRTPQSDSKPEHSSFKP